MNCLLLNFWPILSYIQVSPLDLKEGYLHYSTSKYRLHLYETPSRLRIVLNTDLLAQGVKELLHQIYSQVSPSKNVCPVQVPRPILGIQF